MAVPPDPGLVQARLPAEAGAQPRPHEARAAAGTGRREGAAARGPLAAGVRAGQRARARLGRRLALHVLLLLLLLWRYGTRKPIFLVARLWTLVYSIAFTILLFNCQRTLAISPHAVFYN